MKLSFRKKDNPKRHLLIPEANQSRGEDQRFEQSILLEAAEHASEKKSIEDLKADLQTAMDLELSTIPPYLSALYSIKEGTNLESVEIIKSVVIEEMLHMVMVANLLNAVGGTPSIGTFTPNYPSQLPGNVMPQLIVPLAPFSIDSIRTFEKIEHPEGALQFLSEKDKELARNSADPSFTGIGEFYKAIKDTLIKLEKEAQNKGESIFTPNRNQVSDEQYYGSGGKIITVNNLTDAIQLIDEIVGQGEGTLGTIFSQEYDPKDDDYKLFGPDVEEYAHYFRFKEIRFGRFYAVTDSAHRDSPNKGLPTGQPFKVDWGAMYNFRPNPKLSDYDKGSAVYEKSLEFSKTYTALLKNINLACNGQPDQLIKGVTLMYDLKYKAMELMKIPLDDGKYTAGPCFEIVDCD
ncbi:ferritin-like protein [Roseivirga sp. UBA1976]|uniref:ferritin-like domain-containing protein n=1 Tax=Roseivirga sp. UBA1976 TaxID=1947386 RepID=UPI0025800F3E|nr:ferritin-like protein [Roseivirga sp. UBA1976]|tara:strand:- start:115 stop:1329 length:1215 start_codon:yes stop_codon:yes gene_type:complete